jgi:hypothetical protein
MTESIIGKCKLCLEEGVPLRKSHFLPQATYKILRDENFHNPNPWQLTPRSAVQTSRQVWAHLLCSECEGRFDRNGENWVLKHCLRNEGRFLLKSFLDSVKPDIVSEFDPRGTRIYYASKNPDIDVQALTYFAASMFWRGSIHSWSNDSVPLRLGPFQERFRRYLMNEEAFPLHCFLWVLVREGKDTNRLTYTPLGEKKDTFWVYRFPMPGLVFLLMVGRSVPCLHRAYCFATHANHPIIVTPNVESFLVEEAVKVRQMSLGRLLR